MTTMTTTMTMTTAIRTNTRAIRADFRSGPKPLARRDVARRAFTVGVGGPVGSGKTALVLALCRKLRDERSLAVITNDIFTREDAEFLIRNQALPSDRIDAVETGGCPHAAIREDISANLVALEELNDRFHPEILLLESGGDNLAADFSRELADYTIYVIDVAGRRQDPPQRRAGHYAVRSAGDQQDGPRPGCRRRPGRNGS